VNNLFFQELCPLNLVNLKKNYNFLDYFLAIFAAIALKLGLLFCKKELQFQFVFWCGLLIFARVTPLELRSIEEFFCFPDF
jgi:hypothetical protein